MRILYAALDQTIPGTTGGSVHVRAVADGLAALGHEVHVLAGAGQAGFPPGPIVWHAVAAPLGRPHLRLARAGRVGRVARAIGPDVIVERYHNFGGEAIRAAHSLGLPAALEVNAPVIDYPGSPKRRLDRALVVEPMRRWRDWQCRTASLIVTPSRDILPPWVPADRVLEIEWGADTDRVRPDVAEPPPFARTDEDVVAIFVGAFRGWHGAAHLVEAIARLHRDGRRRFRAVLVGDGPERAAVDAAARAAAGVVTTGAVPHTAVPAYLAGADIGVAPFDVRAHAPLQLGFYWSPLKIFEYMAAALPVVTPAIERLAGIVRHEREGILYDAAEPGALARALARLEDRELRARLGSAARERVVANFSWQAHCRRLDEALRGLVRAPAGTP